MNASRSDAQGVVIGSHRMRIPPDGRLRLPADWRNLFVTSVHPVLLLVPFEASHLAMIPECRIEVVSRAIKAAMEQPRTSDDPQKLRDAAIAGFGATREVRIASEGRFRVPRELWNRAGLLDKSVVLAGCLEYAEIWSREGWKLQEQSWLARDLPGMVKNIGF